MDCVVSFKKPNQYGVFPLVSTAMMIMVTWETLLYTIGFTLIGGDAAGALLVYLIVWLGSLSVATTLGEMASMAPNTSGQPAWIELLAGKKWGRLAGYVASWVHLLGWLGMATCGGYMASLAVTVVAEFSTVGFVMPKWGRLLAYWGAMLYSIGWAILINRSPYWWQSLFATLHILTLMAMLIPALYYAPALGLGKAFSGIHNHTEWDSGFVALMMSLISPAFAFCGWDTPIFLAAEAKKPREHVSRAMVYTILIDGVFGLTTLLVFIACEGNQDGQQLWDSNVQTWEGLAIFIGGTYGGFNLGMLMALCLSFAFVYWFTMAARQMWLLARVNAVPFSKYLKIEEREFSKLPIFAMMAVAVVSSFVMIALEWAGHLWRDCVCLTVVAMNLPTFICNCLLLQHRISDHIIAGVLRSSDISKQEKLVWGPWRLSAKWGSLNNIVACGFQLLLILFTLWPQSPVMPSGFNYAVVILLTFVALGLTWYGFRGRKEYIGYSGTKKGEGAPTGQISLSRGHLAPATNHGKME